MVKFLGLAFGLGLVLWPASALASSHGAAPCDAGRYCNARLGVSLRLPAGWYVVGAKQLGGSNQVAFAKGRPAGSSYNLRLMLRAYAQTSFTDSRQSAQQVAMKLIRAERSPQAFGTPVHYAGSYGLIVRGLPSEPAPSQDIILGRHQYVYQVIAPGKALAGDQRAALNSLQFIPMRGHFLGAGGSR